MPDKNHIEPNTTNQVEVKKKRKFLRFCIIFLGIFVVFVAAAQYLFYYYALPLLKEKICQNVTDNTKGLYTINFDDIKLSVVGRSIWLTNFSMKPDTTVYLNLKANNNYDRAIYNIAIGEFVIKNIKLSSIFGSRKLSINSIDLKSPVIRLAGKPNNNNKGKYDAIHKDLYPLIANYFTIVQVNKLSVKDGFFDFYKTVSDDKEMAVVGNINIDLKDFYVDDDVYQKNNKLFYSDVISITSGGYKIRLADSIHTVNAGNLIINTADSLIFATGVTLLADGSQAKFSNREKFNVTLDTIYVDGIDINKAYFNEVVDISTVLLVNPKINFSARGQRHRLKSNNESNNSGNWYSLIKGTLKGINIDTFKISNASLKVFNNKFTKPAYDVGNINITLLGFLLDSLAYQNKSKILYSNNLDISIKNFDMRLPDGIHLLSSSLLYLSTKNKIVTANRTRIRPLYNTKDTTDTKINISVPKLNISSIDIIKAYNSQIYNIGTLSIFQPHILTKSFNDTSVAVTNKKSMMQLLNDEYFKSLRISKFIVNDSYIDVDQQSSILEDSLTISGQLSFTLFNFETGRSFLSNGNKPFVISNINLKLDNFIMKPSKNIHTFRGKNLTINSKTNEIYLSNISYSADTESLLIPVLQRLNKHSVVDFKIKEAVISNTNLIQGFYQNNVSIGNFKISSPQLVFIDYPHLKPLINDTCNQDTTLLSIQDIKPFSHRDSVLNSLSNLEKYFANILPHSLNILQIDSFSVDSGKISFDVRDSLNQTRFSTDTHFSFGVDRFYFNRDSIDNATKFLFANNYNVKVSNFQFMLPDGIHHVKATNINLDTKTGVIKSDMVFISPNNQYILSNKNIINAYFPSISLLGIDFPRFSKSGVLCTDTCLINNCVFSISKSDNKISHKTDSSNNSSLLNQYLKSIQISKIISDDSKFGIYSNIANISTRTFFAGFNFSLDSLLVDSTNYFTKGHLISFSNPKFHSNDIMFLTKNGDNRISIKYADIFNDTMFVKDIYFGSNDPYYHNIKRGLASAFLPNMLIVKPDFESLAFDKILKAQTILLNNLEAEIVSEKRSPKNQNFDVTKFYNKFNAVVVDTFLANSISLDIYRTNKNSLKLNNLDFKIIGLDTRNIRDNLFPVKEITTGINDYTIYLKDSLYVLHAGRIEFAPDKNDIVVYNVDYRPTTSRYSYYKLFPYRKSATFLACRKVTAHNIDIEQLLMHRNINIEKLSIDNLSLNSYLNRSNPIDTSTLKPNLHQLIRSIPLSVIIDTTLVSNSYISVEQLNPQASVPGVLTINNVSGHIINFTNNNSRLVTDSTMTASVAGKLMGKANIRADFKYFLNSKTDEFIIKAKTDTIFLPDMNPFLENALFARIDDGVMKSTEIEFTSNNKSSTGVSVFRYNRLKLSVNKRDSVQPKRRGLLSFLANSIIRTDNPKHNFSRVKRGYIYTKPDPHKSFTSYWVQSMLSGAKATAGFESKEQKDERKTFSKIKDAISIKHHKEEKQRKTQRKQFDNEIINE